MIGTASLSRSPLLVAVHELENNDEEIKKDLFLHQNWYLIRRLQNKKQRREQVQRGFQGFEVPKDDKGSDIVPQLQSHKQV